MYCLNSETNTGYWVQECIMKKFNNETKTEIVPYEFLIEIWNTSNGKIIEYIPEIIQNTNVNNKTFFNLTTTFTNNGANFTETDLMTGQKENIFIQHNFGKIITGVIINHKDYYYTSLLAEYHYIHYSQVPKYAVIETSPYPEDLKYSVIEIQSSSSQAACNALMFNGESGCMPPQAEIKIPNGVKFQV